MKNIAIKLASIQSELFVPKGKKNEFGGFNYRSCEDILKVLKPLVAKAQCSLYIENRLIQISDRVYVEAVCHLVDCETGEEVTCSAQAREPALKKGMDEMQVTGATSSYARKYALAGMFCIDNEKDADDMDNRDEGKPKPAAPAAKPKPRLSQIAWAEFKKLPDNADADAKDIQERFLKLVTEVTGKTKSADVTDAEWENIRKSFAAFAA